MTKWRIGSILLALAGVLAGGVVLSQTSRDPGFPHEQHAGMFPFCIACHEGVPTGDRAAFYPEPALCAQCHDGVREELVQWTAPVRPVTNLDFEHPVHDELVDRETGQAVPCQQCHTQPAAPRMAVEPAVAERCFACHESHPATDHFVDAVCTTCHVPLAQTRFTAARVQNLPQPVTHAHPDFLHVGHGVLAQQDPTRCSTCHTRELCTACHVDVPRVTTIAQIPGAGPQLSLPAFGARYPVPASHLAPDWETRHGAVATVANCSTCHTREGCETCHQEPIGRTTRVIAQLPAARSVEAPGVTLARRVPESHLNPFFATRHGEAAATRPETCTTCHAQTPLCTSCHVPIAGSALPAATSGELRPTLAVTAAAAAAPPVRLAPARARPPLPADTVAQRAARAARVHVPSEIAAATPQRRAPRSAEFHPPGFATHHASAAYSRRMDCAQCHNQRTFCKDCHEQAGFQARGRLAQGFHDAEPLWLLRHGQAARQTLETCTTCHAQRDCLSCHSDLGAFRVNPHRSDFDARRAQRRNPTVCFNCHLSDPLGGTTP
jgi:hypothetical protein